MPVTTTIDTTKTDIYNIPFGLKTYEELLFDLKKSRKEYSMGKCKDANEVVREIRMEYGL